MVQGSALVPVAHLYSRINTLQAGFIQSSNLKWCDDGRVGCITSKFIFTPFQPKLESTISFSVSVCKGGKGGWGIGEEHVGHP